MLTSCGGKEVAEDPRFQTPQGRVEHVEEVDGVVAGWIAKHDLKTVLDEFEKAEAAIGPAYSIDQIFEDPQYQAREDIIAVEDEDLAVEELELLANA